MFGAAAQGVSELIELSEWLYPGINGATQYPIPVLSGDWALNLVFEYIRLRLWLHLHLATLQQIMQISFRNN